MLDRRSAILGLMLACSLGTAEAREARAPASKVFPYLKGYLALPPGRRDRFHLTYRLKAKSGRLTGARAWLEMDGRRAPLAIGPDGRVHPPETGAELERGEVIFMFSPDAKVGIELDVAATLPARTEYTAAALQACLDQANAGTRSGFSVLRPPRLRRFVFQGAQSGEWAPRAGRRSGLPVGADGPAFEPDGVVDGVVVLRRPPTAIILEAKG